jgi:hypothetical protein
MWDLGQANPSISEADRHENGATSASVSAEPREDREDNIDPREELSEGFAKSLSEAPQAVEIDGFCELPNGFDRSCRTRTIGPGAVDVVYQDSLDATDKRRAWDSRYLNETVHLDLDHVGRFHGVLTEHTSDGFHVSVDPKFGGLLLSKLARYMAYDMPVQQKFRGGVAAQLPNQRVVPKFSFCTYRDANGVLYKGSLVSLSPLDAIVKTRTLPEVNSLIVFCGRRQRKAHVIRRLESGFSALFVDPLGDQEFSADIRLTDEFPDYV